MTKQAERKKVAEEIGISMLGEEMACHYLNDNGIKILERNWECNSGMADIVALEGETLVFMTVITRPQGQSGLPEYPISADRRLQQEMIAISYLESHQRPSSRVRFDVIAVKMTGEQQCLLRHHRDAFGAGSDLPQSREGEPKATQRKDRITPEKKPEKKASKSKALAR